MVGQIIEITAVLIGLFLVLKNADNFQKAFGTIGQQYVNAVSVLQGGSK